ncbi:RNA recognition motif domain - like 10 [Theobroma cacao]|nr:RNA recognition motif domain - like 10 [Theobroma cacao]
MSYSRETRSVSPARGRRSRSLSRSRRSRSRSRSRSQDASNPGNNLYVTGLSTRVTTADLEKYFGNEGKVVECHLVTDPRTRESRGFAFVTMETVEGAERCIKYLNRSVLEGLVCVASSNSQSKLLTVQPEPPSDMSSASTFQTHRFKLDYFAEGCKKVQRKNTNSWEDKVADGLVATHLDDMIEIIIQGAGKGDHALVPPMVGKEMIMTHTGGAESAPCPAMAVVIVDERKSFSSQA